MLNAATHIRRELLIRLVRAFDSGRLRDELDRIPIKLRPRTGGSSRCCVYHDRAVLKYRLMALLGICAEDETDEAKTLGEYLEDRLYGLVTGKKGRAVPLSVCGPACSGCPDSKIVSTPNCRGCFARPCTYACPKGAVSVVDGHSVIDQSKCIKCGKCITACPYHAIIRTTVPCEEACPVKAISKNAQGVAEIDFERCIFCGKCFNACPFSAVMERSQILDVLLAMKRGGKIVAMVAPSAEKQFPGKIEQLFAACIKAGFSDVVEVALGAEMTTEHETAEFLERMQKDPKTFMTTSCCPAWVNLARKHMPELMKNVSTTPSPMVFAKEIVKKRDPSAKTVFIGPCIAKRNEALRKDVDYVLSFEELGALLAGRDIDVIAQEPLKLERPANPTARNYAVSCGVTEAVLGETAGKIPGFKLNSQQINGIDRKTCAMLKVHASGRTGVNFLEVMACQGGCVNGPCSLTTK